MAWNYATYIPHPYFLEVWRAAAPSVDFYPPDIYWPNFEYWVERYEIPGNPLFVPEARLESGPYNFQQAIVAQSRRPAVQREQAIVQGKRIALVDPDWFLHLARTWSVLR